MRRRWAMKSSTISSMGTPAACADRSSELQTSTGCSVCMVASMRTALTTTGGSRLHIHSVEPVTVVRVSRTGGLYGCGGGEVDDRGGDVGHPELVLGGAAVQA